MTTNFKITVGLINKYPVIEGFNNLTEEQREAVQDQSWYEDDFSIAKWEKFWNIDDVIFSVEMDLNDLGNFAFDGWQFQYSVGGEDFVCRFTGDEREFIEVAKFVVEVVQN